MNYLEMYRLADLFHLPALERAVVSFLVEHLSELQHSNQEEVLKLPYSLLKEVLKSDQLTSLNEEQIWLVGAALSRCCPQLEGAAVEGWEVLLCFFHPSCSW